jgi:hypothetical protein
MAEIWTPITSLTVNSSEYNLVSNLIKDFIDTDESGIKAVRDTANGRLKCIRFTFNHTNPTPPTDTQVGIVELNLEYPSGN